MPERSGFPSGVLGVVADMSGLPSAPRGTLPVGRLRHWAAAGAARSQPAIHRSALVVHTSLRYRRIAAVINSIVGAVLGGVNCVCLPLLTDPRRPRCLTNE